MRTGRNLGQGVAIRRIAEDAEHPQCLLDSGHLIPSLDDSGMSFCSSQNAFCSVKSVERDAVPIKTTESAEPDRGITAAVIEPLIGRGVRQE
jgi:hypothetical protein